MLSIKRVRLVILARKGISSSSKRVLAETDMIYAYFLRSKCGKNSCSEGEGNIAWQARPKKKESEAPQALIRPRLFLTNKEASTVLCSVVKHLGSSKHSTASRVFPFTSFMLYRFLRALQQKSTVEASLFVNHYSKIG